MAYISPIAIETALRSIDEAAPESIRHDHATEAAHILLATSRRHARRFALAMHGRVGRGLDVAMIEHWARVVMEVDRMKQRAAGYDLTGFSMQIVSRVGG
jgi:hypothetical protein